MTIEAQLVRHLRDTSFSNLSAEAVAAARREVLWALGTSVAGAAAAGSKEVIDFVRQLGGREESTVLGFGGRFPASMAGLANGCFAKALEYEDKLWIGRSHGLAIGAAVVPAAFAVAEHLGGVDGKTLLTAVAVATDVQARLVADAIGRQEAMGNTNTSGWNLTYVFAAFGAAMAAGKLLDLNELEFLDAMGLAYAQAAGSRQGNVEGVLGVRMQMGFSVRNGVTAAQLAKLGISGVKGFLTGQFGLYRQFLQLDETDLTSLTSQLGQRFDGIRLGFKAYPCGVVAHPVIDAVLSLPDDIDTSAIERVRVHGTRHLRLMVEPQDLRREPRTHAEAEFSLPWVVACALIDRDLSPSHFSEPALKDERYRDLAKRVETDMDVPTEGAFVELAFRNGRRERSRTVLVAKGHPDNPQSTAEMAARIRACIAAAPAPLPMERTELALELILHLQDVSDAAEVVRLLAPPPVKQTNGTAGKGNDP